MITAADNLISALAFITIYLPSLPKPVPTPTVTTPETAVEPIL